MLAQPENEQPDKDLTRQNKQEVVPITISCSLSEFKGRDTIDTAFQRAGKALYNAKYLDRNRYIAVW